MSTDNHILRFWGVRGSTPTDDPDKAHIGGNTSCVEVRASDGAIIIFDAGTGIRTLGHKIAREHDSAYEINLFLSHTHWDHILGLPFFEPMHQSFATINIYGPERAGLSLEKSILGLFQSPYFPLGPEDIEAKLTFTELNTGQTTFGNGYTMASSPHPHPNGALSYRLTLGNRHIVFITDIEHTKDKLSSAAVEISKDADILIHDAHFTVEDLPAHRSWGHSSWEAGTQVAKLAGAQSVYLFHFSPDYSDEDIDAMERAAQADFANTFASHQGLTVEISPS
jgi:ribonuclease Z